MSVAISRTRPFRHLQAVIGFATYRVGTAIVGLELVAAGGDKPQGLPISWRKPKDAKSAREVADQARRFVLTSALVLVIDTFDEYLRRVAVEAWLRFPAATRDIATKAFTRAGNKAFSIAERAEALCDDLGLADPGLLALVDLAASWRNDLVHADDARPVLASAIRAALETDAERIRREYAHLDVSQLLDNFDSGQAPSTKEATSMIAVVQNLARKIDAAAILRVARTETGVEETASALLASHFSLRAMGTRSAWAELSDLWQGSNEQRRSKLMKVFERIGFTGAKDAVSKPLPERFLLEMVELDLEGIAKRLGVERVAVKKQP